MNRSTLYFVLITISFIVGCSSDNDNPLTDDSGPSTSDETNDGNGISTGDELITGNSPDNPVLTPVSLPTIREDVLNDLAGYQSEALAEK